VLRRKIIETMLYMTRTFPFCSIAQQQGILVLNLMREAFDEQDLETLKTFVREELERDTNFYFGSGRKCSRMNIGQIVKIAFELRNITQKALDDIDSSEDEEPDNQESIEKRSQMQSWFHFCEQKVSKIEKVWNRKLEQPEPEVVVPSNVAEQEKPDDHEHAIEEMFKKLNHSGRMSRSQSAQQREVKDEALIADILAHRDANTAKDDVFNVETTTGEFGDNQFWKKPEYYDIDDLMREMENGS
jgi:hypothetical protein